MELAHSRPEVPPATVGQVALAPGPGSGPDGLLASGRLTEAGRTVVSGLAATLHGQAGE